MAYVPQTPANLRALYPEFTTEKVSDSYVNIWLAHAERETDVTWREEDRAPAVLALTAHWLAELGYLGAAVVSGGSGGTTIGGIPVTGAAQSARVGDVEVRFAQSSGGSSGGGSSGGGSASNPFVSTHYGRRWYELWLRNRAQLYIPLRF